jgi:signal transduction histidine kinase
LKAERGILRELEGRAIKAEGVEDELARFKAILERAPYGVHFVEAGTEKITASHRAYEIMGQEDVPTVSDYRGWVCSIEGKPLPKADWPGLWVLRTKERFSTRQLLLRTPDGREVPVFGCAAPVFRTDGDLDGAVVVYEDISLLKEVERQREAWASVVTHDLRQPLSVIAAYLDVLQRTDGDVDPALLAKGLSHAQRAVRMMNRMICDLSDVSSIEANRFELQRQSIDLSATVREVVENHRLLAPDRAITLSDGGPFPRVEADPVRIAQVVGNLSGNALKYSEPGSAVQVEVRRVASELCVGVTNRGAGISAEELPNLFQRHYRTASARSGPARGLGLGLYISKAFVEAHGGRIWAESRPGETTTFQFTLPVTQM